MRSCLSSSGPKCCSAVATLPEFPFLLSSSFQHLPPGPSPLSPYFTEKRSNQRLQAPTTASGVLRLPSSKTATYQQHLMNRWVTLPAPQNPFFQGLQGSHSLSLFWFFSASLAASSLLSVLISPQPDCGAPGINPLIFYLFFTNTHFQSELILSQGFHTPSKL